MRRLTGKELGLILTEINRSRTLLVIIGDVVDTIA
jgi:hypothetical protein